jgi:hypothetical protein
VPILDDIRRAISDGAYRIAAHAADQMVAESLDEIWVLEATISGRVLEEFPMAFPHPSCLLQGRAPPGRPLHLVWSHDPGSGYAVLLTFSPVEDSEWVGT